MNIYGGEVNKLISELSHLPGVGSKTAQRLAYYKYAGGEGGGSGVSHSQCQEEDKILFLLLYHNRQRPVSYMQSTGKKPQDNNGGGDAEGYGGI